MDVAVITHVMWNLQCDMKFTTLSCKVSLIFAFRRVLIGRFLLITFLNIRPHPKTGGIPKILFFSFWKHFKTIYAKSQNGIQLQRKLLSYLEPAVEDSTSRKKQWKDHLKMPVKVGLSSATCVQGREGFILSSVSIVCVSADRGRVDVRQSLRRRPQIPSPSETLPSSGWKGNFFMLGVCLCVTLNKDHII